MKQNMKILLWEYTDIWKSTDNCQISNFLIVLECVKDIFSGHQQKGKPKQKQQDQYQQQVNSASMYNMVGMNISSSNIV